MVEVLQVCMCVCVSYSVSQAQVYISRSRLEACGLMPATTSPLDWIALAEQLATKVLEMCYSCNVC